MNERIVPPTFYCQRDIHSCQESWCDFDGHHVCGVALLRQNKLRRYLTRPVTSTPDNSFSLWTSSTLYISRHYSWIKIPYLLGSPQCEKHVQIGLKHNIWVQLIAWLCPSQISLSLKWTAPAFSSSPINPSPIQHIHSEESVVIGPESDHCSPLSLTNWLTHSCLVDLIDVTLACEDANSVLVEVVLFCWCWWEMCWWRLGADLEAEVWS